MKTKTKLTLSCLIMFLGSVFSLFFSAGICEVLAKQAKTFRIPPLNECISIMTADKKCLLFFLVLEGFLLMLCLLLITTNTKPYRSTLITITPDIKIPAPVGQFQHGSAKFLSDKEKDSAFDSFILDPAQNQIKELIKTGYEDLEFLRVRNGIITNKNNADDEGKEEKSSEQDG